MIPRNKRKLIPVVQVLSAFHLAALDERWSGAHNTQLKLEETLESLGIKREGPRRDQGGSGARTYESWLACLGLIFTEESTGFQRPTIAGELLLKGAPPKNIITDQLIKFQYPSSYSLRQNVKLSERFKVHPFRFILTLLYETDIDYLTQEEIALFVITEGENNSEKCLAKVADRIKDFRSDGIGVLPDNFNELYPARTGVQPLGATINRLNELANTFMNYIEYTQLVSRDNEKNLRIIKPTEVQEILAQDIEFIDRPENQEYFQRKFGLAAGKTKDTRSFGLSSVSSQQIQSRLIETCFLSMAAKGLISADDPFIVRDIADKTGCQTELVSRVLSDYYGREAGIFESKYFEMARAGKDQAADFEHATVELFGEKGFGFEADHVGSRRLSPDVYVFSSNEGFSGIIDNKAYASYSINNDHKNRMVHNYLPFYQNKDKDTLRFFMYIAGGFKSTFSEQLKQISSEVDLKGSGISASNVIKLLDIYKTKRLNHKHLEIIFTLDREIIWNDIVGL